MGIELKAVERNDIERVWKMQIEAFSDLLHRYRDYDINPGAESIEQETDLSCLDHVGTQEKGNLHLYEKLGYHQTGRVDKINDRMDIVFYEKD